MAAQVKKRQTYEEEVANVITHGGGVLLGLVGVFFLMMKAVPTNNWWVINTMTVYSIGMLTSFAASALYHAATSARKKRLLRRFDHSAIYLYIAGTYTPFSLLALRQEGAWGWIIFSIVWFSAIVGISQSFRHMRKQNHLKTACYLVMGWIIVIAFKPLLHWLQVNEKMDIFYWLIAGGAAYTLGSVCFFFDTHKYMHPLWHLFVLAGGVCHFMAVYLLI